MQLEFEVQDYATFNMARCDRKERLDTDKRDRGRKKRTVAERETRKEWEKQKREWMEEGERKKYLCRCGQYWRIVGLGRQLSLTPGFKLPCVPECWWGRFLFNEPEDSTVFITIDVYSLYYPNTTVKPMKPPFTISLSNCEENDGIKTGRWTTLLAVTGASLVALYQTANWQRPKLNRRKYL